MPNPLWFIFWLLVFWFVSFFVAFFCAFFYIWVYAFASCIPALTGISEILLQGVQFPFYCGKAMLEGKQAF
ncbi:uncharacterized protein [Drosophila kikkawai]|uniref:Uncharacterized protein n=1 Tax=Drosophila kikkawai TaxID=30033 RepID=A0A6P4HYK9_DROKI|nr:uncharacterized protein LOC108023534 [Drosophila biarmipes]XP_017021497.1 uncharacterized protein LOC108074111 [Drosophila kikkawai]XP_020809731.1 uncharacterized protein LOC110185312 [Drosophila serrata]KAH8243658.1 hypothetical protein KR032_009162 [Drosophila birchii]KAH8247634.1 hypothetical protein KR038_007353 [Drosophila bunnanda]KAH8292969.1 hypothetical protein KR054_001542 [Drosophila jambulina]KAH8349046.1 hypothetical protein KR084_000070 [Drosophila pseudotakahashii]KAH833644